MLKHHDIWRGIDLLAARNGLSPSGLAKRAGLDPTTFNKSKRTTKEGKLRWPSTESLAKILEATGTNMGEFVGLLSEAGDRPNGASHRLQMVRLGQLRHAESFDAAGFLTRGGEETEFPSIDEPNAYVVELDDDVAEPAYRAGDMVVVSPGSSIRRQDRVIVRRKDGSVSFAVLNRRTAQRLTLTTFDHVPREEVIDTHDVAWVARILWVSQ